MVCAEAVGHQALSKLFFLTLLLSVESESSKIKGFGGVDGNLTAVRLTRPGRHLAVARQLLHVKKCAGTYTIAGWLGWQRGRGTTHLATWHIYAKLLGKVTPNRPSSASLDAYELGPSLADADLVPRVVPGG